MDTATYKTTLLDSENSKSIIEKITQEGSTFKEYDVDEFLGKLMHTMNLFENGKYCTKCKKMKDIQEFGRTQNWCKECKNTSFKEYYKRNKEKMRENMKNEYEKRNHLMTCTCGKVIHYVSYKSHLKTKCHLKENIFTLVSQK